MCYINKLAPILVFLISYVLLNLLFSLNSSIDKRLLDNTDIDEYKLSPDYTSLFIFILSIFLLITYDLFKFKLCYYYHKTLELIFRKSEYNKELYRHNYVLIAN